MIHRAALTLVPIVALQFGAVAPAGAQEDGVAAAAEAFDRGIELFNEGRHEAALAEFQRAYDLAPAGPVLYNLGRVHAALGHAVEAVTVLERYLAEGSGVSAARRREVDALLSTHRGRIATLTVETNVGGSVVSVDGIDLATTPMSEPIRVTAGRLTVGARAPGHEAIRRSIQIAGGVDRTLQIELRPEAEARGTIRIAAAVPGVRVLLDGQAMGLTPLDRTLPVAAGAHVVVGERAGYASARIETVVEDGAEVELHLDMGRDPATARENLGRLRLHMPEASYALHIDEEVVETRGGTAEVVAGPHRLEVVCVDREPYRTSIEIPSGGSLDLTPALEWTPDARAERLEDADESRSLGWILTLPGALLLATGVPLGIWNEMQISDTDRRITQRNEEFAACVGLADCEEGVDSRYGDLAGDRDGQNILRVVVWLAAGLGLAGTVAGLALLIGAPTEDTVDRAAHADAGPTLRLGVGPGSLGISGSF